MASKSKKLSRRRTRHRLDRHDRGLDRADGRQGSAKGGWKGPGSSKLGKGRARSRTAISEKAGQ